MAEPTYMRLRPYGDGYSVEGTEGRKDSPMFVKRFMPPPAQPATGTLDTGVSIDDYSAVVAGWHFDNAAATTIHIYMHKNTMSGFWEIKWEFAAGSGANPFFDIFFAARGFCADVTP